MLSTNGGDPRAILAVLNYILTHSINRKLIMEASQPEMTEEGDDVGDNEDGDDDYGDDDDTDDEYVGGLTGDHSDDDDDDDDDDNDDDDDDDDDDDVDEHAVRGSDVAHSTERSANDVVQGQGVHKSVDNGAKSDAIQSRPAPTENDAAARHEAAKLALKAAIQRLKDRRCPVKQAIKKKNQITNHTKRCG